MKNLFEGIYQNRKVLITGHTGFKGSWLALWLRQMGAEVAVGVKIAAADRRRPANKIVISDHQQNGDGTQSIQYLEAVSFFHGSQLGDGSVSDDGAILGLRPQTGTGAIGCRAKNSVEKPSSRSKCEARWTAKMKAARLERAAS